MARARMATIGGTPQTCQCPTFFSKEANRLTSLRSNNSPSWRIPPPSAVYREVGLQFFKQAVVDDSGAPNPVKLIVSNPTEGRIGG